MSETKVAVKRIREMSDAEVAQLPRLNAELIKNTFKKGTIVNFVLKVEVAKDYTEEIKLNEEQYAMIKLQRDITYDAQKLVVYGRMSSGQKETGETFKFLEIVAAKGVYFNVLLTKFRNKQVDLMISKNAWPKNLELGIYPDAVEEINEVNLA